MEQMIVVIEADGIPTNVSLNIRPESVNLVRIITWNLSHDYSDTKRHTEQKILFFFRELEDILIREAEFSLRLYSGVR
jgi:hypothetical protein